MVNEAKQIAGIPLDEPLESLVSAVLISRQSEANPFEQASKIAYSLVPS